MASYYVPNGKYAFSATSFTTDKSAGPLHLVAGSSRYIYGSDAYPNQTSSNDYFIDPVFSETTAPLAPSVTHSEPSDNSYGVDTHKPITFQFSEPIDATTAPGALALKTTTGTSVAGTTTYDTSTGIVTFTPSAQLNYATAYVLTISNALKTLSGTSFTNTGYSVHFTTGVAATTTLNDGKGGPILIITGSANKFSTYTAEILRSEGINYFSVRDISQLTPALLANYQYVLLGNLSLSDTQVNVLTSWVNGGGKLIAFRPDKKLAGLLGISDDTGSISDGYLKVDTSKAPGLGIVGDTIQYHTAADLYSTTSATTVSTLYSDETTATSHPATTMRAVGNGYAAAFTYDLPQSIALTHQGNPLYVNHAAGDSPIRPDALFHYGAGQTDWLNLSKAHIPQADEQQRLLVNMINDMSKSSGPLPHFWYLPHGYKAALAMTSDDHGTNGGTSDFFNKIALHNVPNCSVIDWTCERVGSLIYVSGGPSAALVTKAAKYGFPTGVHVTTNCNNIPDADLTSAYTNQLAYFATNYPDQPPQNFSRIHCYAWTGWADAIKIDQAFGIHLDITYEFFPPSWTGSNTGLITGSSQIMRFADSDGTLLDVYNSPTDLDYETDPTATSVNADLAAATGSEGAYGIYGTHYDFSNSYQDLLVTSAKAHGVPLITDDQAIAWKNAQTNSSFAITENTANRVVFSPEVAEGGEGSVAMLPTTSSNGTLNSLTTDGRAVSYTNSTIKGVEYAVFNAAPGTYTALYGTQPSDAANSNLQSTTPTSAINTGNHYASIVTETTPSSVTAAAPQQQSSGVKSTGNATNTEQKDTPTMNTPISSRLAPYIIPSAIGLLVVGGGSWWALAIRRRHLP